MKLELKNIEVNVGMSEETNCYSASLWVDGKRVGTVGNAGHGGADSQHIEQGLLNGINAWLANNIPPYKSEDIEIMYDLELWCSDQIGEHLLERDMQNAFRRKVLYSHAGTIYEIPRGKHKQEAIVAHLRKKYGEDTKILNLMERKEALALYRTAAAA